MKFIIEGFKNLQNNYQIIENENVNLKNKIIEIETIQKGGKNNTQIINNNDNRQINKGIIQNNFIVQFVHDLLTFLYKKVNNNVN